MQMLAYTLDDAHNRHIHGIGRQFIMCYFFFQAEDGIRDADVTGVQTCALPISPQRPRGRHPAQPRDLRRGDRGRGGQPVQAAALHRRAAPRDDRRGDHQPRRGPAPAHRLVRRAPHRPRRPRARRLHRAWHSRRVGLRVRVPDGAHEPQAAVDRRDGVPHAAREVHVHLIEVDQGGRQFRNVCRRNGSTGRRKAAHRKISVEMMGGSERPPYPPVLADRLKTLAPSSTLAVQAKARELGAVPVAVPTREATGFDLDPDGLRAAVTPRTKLIVLNSPNNPTGAVFSREALEAVARLAVERGLWVVADECYESLTFEGRHVSIASLGPEIKTRTLVVNTCSKAYAKTGWRIGYAAGARDGGAGPRLRLGRPREALVRHERRAHPRGPEAHAGGDRHARLMKWGAPKWPPSLFKREGYAPSDSPASARGAPAEP